MARSKAKTSAAALERAAEPVARAAFDPMAGELDGWANAVHESTVTRSAQEWK